jgi:hypothetical protein
MSPKNEIGSIWRSADGKKSWRARFREVQAKMGLDVTEPELPQEEPKASAKDKALEKIAAKKTAAPEAKTITIPVNVAELQASVVNLRKEVSDWKAKFDHKSLMLERLERSMGLAAAQNIITVPNDGGEHLSPLQKLNSIQDEEERSKFYSEHRSELSKLINVPNPQP